MIDDVRSIRDLRVRERFAFRRIAERIGRRSRVARMHGRVSHVLDSAPDLRIAFGHRPWLPKFILNRSISFSVLEKMVHFGCAIYERVEKVIRPRLGILLDAPGMGMMIGSAIALSGVFLSLPIPPPFPLTNTIPGFAIICLSLGLMEKDGGLILCGYVLTVIAAIYVALIGFLGKAGVDQLWQIFRAP